jgi:hypothetical protein
MTIVLHDLILFGLIALIAMLWFRSYNQNDRLHILETLVEAFMDMVDNDNHIE